MVLLRDDIDVEIISDSDQKITIKIFIPEDQEHMLISMMYAKCTKTKRISLWNNIYNLAIINLALLIERNFSTLQNEEEKIGGFPVIVQEVKNFAFCVNSCELEEIPFKVNPFTW